MSTGRGTTMPQSVQTGPEEGSWARSYFHRRRSRRTPGTRNPVRAPGRRSAVAAPRPVVHGDGVVGRRTRRHRSRPRSAGASRPRCPGGGARRTSPSCGVRRTRPRRRARPCALPPARPVRPRAAPGRGAVLGSEPGPGAQVVPGRSVPIRGEPLKALAQRVAPQRQIAPRVSHLSRQTPETGHRPAPPSHLHLYFGHLGVVERTSPNRRIDKRFGSIRFPMASISHLPGSKT